MPVLKVTFRDKNEFLEAYDDQVAHGGLFCPTTQPLDEGQPVLVQLRFPELPNKMLFRGRVVSWRSALPRLRVRAGAMVAFDESETDKRDFVLAIARGAIAQTIKRRHARLPVAMAVRWRFAAEAEFLSGNLSDISIGGANLQTERQLAEDDDLVIELMAPGGAQPIPIAATVCYRTSAGFGIRFIYRDGGGSRRLREVVRRLVQSG